MSTTPIVTPLSPSTSDERLIAAIRCGDDRAFEELHRRYRPRVGSYVLSLVGDHGKAEDITQEIFISALRRLRVTDRPILFKPWIFEIAKNACIDQSRRAQRSREVLLDEEPEPIGNRSHLRLAPDPDTAITRKQQLADLCGAFGTLSETHHQVLVMRELEGRSYTEIAYKLGMTVPVVESTLFRARRKLGEEYDEIASGRRCEQVCATVDSIGGGSIRTLGTKERRRLALHLSHCQPCRREALAVGFDVDGLRPKRVAERVAALLPFPWLARTIGKRSSSTASHSAGAVRWADNLSRFAVGPGGIGAGKAIATFVAVAAAGVGGGLATHAISFSGSTGAAATATSAHGSAGARGGVSRAAHHNGGANLRTLNHASSTASGAVLGSGSAGAAPPAHPATVVNLPAATGPAAGGSTSSGSGTAPSSGTMSGTDHHATPVKTGSHTGTPAGGSSTGTGTSTGTTTGTTTGTGTGTGTGTTTGTGTGTGTGSGGGKTHGHGDGGNPSPGVTDNGIGNGNKPGNGGFNAGAVNTGHATTTSASAATIGAPGTAAPATTGATTTASPATHGGGGSTH
jgi:RNA polymerase sigma factor (sigma-70 family)